MRCTAALQHSAAALLLATNDESRFDTSVSLRRKQGKRKMDWAFVIFGFAVLGAAAAGLKHTFAPLSTLQELSPVAVKHTGLSPESLWWGFVHAARR